MRRGRHGNELLNLPDQPWALPAPPPSTSLVDGSGGLQFIGSQDTAVEWLRTDLLTLEEAQVGQWQSPCTTP